MPLILSENLFVANPFDEPLLNPVNLPEGSSISMLPGDKPTVMYKGGPLELEDASSVGKLAPVICAFGETRFITILDSLSVAIISISFSLRL